MQPIKSQDPSWPLRVKTALFKRGETVTDLAIAIKKSRVAVSQAINHGLHAPTCLEIAAYLKIQGPSAGGTLWHAA